MPGMINLEAPLMPSGFALTSGAEDLAPRFMVVWMAVNQATQMLLNLYLLEGADQFLWVVTLARMGASGPLAPSNEEVCALRSALGFPLGWAEAGPSFLKGTAVACAWPAVPVAQGDA